MSSTERQQCAEQRARRELAMAADSPWSAAEASVALKYALVDLNSRGIPPQPHFDRLCAEWDWSNTSDGDSVRRALLYNSDYRRRLDELATESLMSQRLAPELGIMPHPLTPSQLHTLLPAEHNHAVLFASSLLFTHEFYPLVVDAFSFDSERRGRPFFNVLGIHLDWIDPMGHAQRAIAVDLEHNRLVEAPLERALPIHSAHFLCLGSGERARHKEWSTRLAIPQINPVTAAILADDKCATTSAWADAGLQTPPFIPIGPRDLQAAIQFVSTHGEAVIKPNADSEGRGVAYIQSPDDFAAYWRTTRSSQNALLQARRDRVFFKDPQTQTIRTLALRLNVGSDGVYRQVESGYAQLGAHTRSPASRGRDGAIAALADLENNLVYKSAGHWQPLFLGAHFWRETTTCAERGAAIFSDLLLVGLDLIIDVDGDGRPSALLLEANPRPAGLCHARLLRNGQAGVGAAMWRGLHAHLAEPAIVAFEANRNEN